MTVPDDLLRGVALSLVSGRLTASLSRLEGSPAGSDHLLSDVALFWVG